MVNHYGGSQALVLKLYLGQDEVSFEDYLIMKGANIIEAEYCMTKLVDMALGHKIDTPSFDLIVGPLNSLDVDESPSHVVKLADAQHHVQLLGTFLMDNPLEFTPTNVMKLRAIMKKLNNISIANLKWQHR